MVKTDNQTVINNVIYVTLNIQVSDNVFNPRDAIASAVLAMERWLGGWLGK